MYSGDVRFINLCVLFLLLVPADSYFFYGPILKIQVISAIMVSVISHFIARLFLFFDQTFQRHAADKLLPDILLNIVCYFQQFNS